MPVRKELAARTIFNVLGPLCNPALPKRMVIGVYDKKLCSIIADAALQMGKQHVLVVHGNDGMDEISTVTTTHICELVDNKILEYEFSPEEYGIKQACPLGIQGGTPSENGILIKSIFEGTEQGAPRDIVALNAAAGILVSGKAENWQDAITIAYETIASGKALNKLKQLIRASNDLSGL
jgi:anthranilate phosphoribosyltransferase